MEGTLKDSRPSSPFPGLDEEETSEQLNEACLLSDSEVSFNDQRFSCDFSNTVIPETPESTLIFRGKRHSQVNDHYSGAALYGPDAKKSERKETVPGYLHITPHSHRTLKRRRLHDHVPGVHDRRTGNEMGFVPASSLLSEFLLESPCPSQSISSTSTVTCTSVAPELSELGAAAAAQTCSNKTSSCGRASGEKLLDKCNKLQRRTKKTSTRISNGSSRSTSTAVSLAAEERHLQDTERRGGCVQEDIVIIDEDDDDMVVEATVRSIQMAEDEAFARSLQEQFDREEQFQQEQRRFQTSPSRNSQNPPFDSYVGLSWISPWASMMHSSSFSELQQATAVGQPGRQTRQTRGGRGSRRRNSPHVSLDLLDDSQGNNYEALLAFEEIQGSVMGKKTLSKGEIERLPLKAYDPAHSAGKTDCQICFSDYKKGEKLRMLPCFHDYHVKCIDRWLKENATCPICRADVSL